MNVYVIDLVLPFATAGFVVQGMQVMEFTPAPGGPFEILVGRDILCQGTFALSFDGHFTLSL